MLVKNLTKMEDNMKQEKINVEWKTRTDQILQAKARRNKLNRLLREEERIQENNIKQALHQAMILGIVKIEVQS